MPASSTCLESLSLRRLGRAWCSCEEVAQALLGAEPELLVALPQAGGGWRLYGPPAGGIASLFVSCEAVELYGLLGAAQHPHADGLDGCPVAELLRDGLGQNGLASARSAGDPGTRLTVVPM